MSDRIYRITGKVVKIVDQHTRKPLPGIRIEAWDKDFIFDDWVGNAQTDASGWFVLEFPESRFRECFFDQEPDLYFKLFRGNTLIMTTEDSVYWNISSGEDHILIEVDMAMDTPPIEPLQYTVKGKLSGAVDAILSGLSVQVFAKPNGEPKTFLAETKTGVEGQYQARFDWRETDKPDIFIRVYDGDELLGESPVIRNAENPVTVDLYLLKGPKQIPQTEFNVSGIVRSSQDSRPLAKLNIRAFDQGLRDRRVLLGETQTGADGRYAIGYAKNNLLDPNRGSANLRLEAFDGEGDLVVSAVLFNARPWDTVDLWVDTEVKRSEWERVNALIKPLLADIPLTGLDGNDLTFIKQSTGLAELLLKARIGAEQLASASGLAEEFHYALLRQGLPETWSALLDLPIARVRAALASAVQARTVAQPTEADAAKLWRQFEDLQARHALSKPLPGSQHPVGRLLQAAGLEEEAQASLAIALAGKDLGNPALWHVVQAETDLKPTEIARTQFTLRSINLTDDHLGAATALLQDKRVSSLRDVARVYGLDEWNVLVGQSFQEDGGDLPQDLTGKTPQQWRDQYAKRLFGRVAESFPDVAVIYGLTRQPKLESSHAARLIPEILESDPGFNLAETRIDAYIRQNKDSLGISDTEETKVSDDLKRVQRVYRLRAEPTAVARLLEDKLDSSSAILSQGREGFLAQYGVDLGVDTARTIYDRAEVNAARAIAIFSRFSPLMNSSPTPAVIGGCPAELTGVPDYASLFGSLDGCECAPCESVYSPAAYLADLLAFVEHEVKRDAASALAPEDGLQALKLRSFCDRDKVLHQDQTRRPDLLEVKLSCINAETVLPYVDLVLEILENSVAPRPNGSPQTTLSADELAAQPEHVISDAYTKLADAIFPFSLPFDLWQEETTLYLSRLGTGRSELLETLFPFVSEDNDQTWDLTEIRRWQNGPIARERLGLTPTEWQLIAGLPLMPARFASEAWGYAAGVNWWQPLKQVDVFLQRSGLEYPDLLRLLTLKSFNADGQLRLAFENLNSCGAKTIHIENLDEEALEYLHRFLRLQRALGLTLQETDQVLVALAPKTSTGRRALDEALLIRLSHCLRLRDKFLLPLPELLAWWSNLDTADYNAPNLPPSRSFYQTLFLEGHPGDVQLPIAALAGALGLPVTDVAALVQGIAAPDANLNLPNLSLVYRHASLARALRLSIADYLSLKNLVSFDPFAQELVDALHSFEAALQQTQAASPPTIGEIRLLVEPTKKAIDADVILYSQAPFKSLLDGLLATLPTADSTIPVNPSVIAPKLSEIIALLINEIQEILRINTIQTLRFIERAEAVAGSGFAIAEIDYLLRQTAPYPSGKTVAPTEEWETASLEKLRDVVIPLTSFFAPLHTLEQAIQRLGADPAPAPTVGQLRPLVEQVLAQIAAAGIVDAENPVKSLLEEALTALDPANLAANVIRQTILPKLTQPQAILKSVVTEPVAQLLGEILSVTSDIMVVLLKQVLSPVIDETVDLAILRAFSPEAPASSNDELASILRRLHKTALAVTRLKITAKELPKLAEKCPATGWLDIAALPVREDDKPAPFDYWLRLVRLIQFRQALLPDQQTHLFELFDIADQYQPGAIPFASQQRKDFAAKLTGLSGWNGDDILALVGMFDIGTIQDTSSGGILKATFPRQFADERLPRRILAAVALLRRLGISALEAQDWIAPTATADQRSAQVGRIKQTLKARLGESWADAVKTLRAPLCECQRQALVAYLLHQWNLADPSDLYDHFLIDVEMSPCMMTSRLIQATASVQLFVQRLLMNLEPGLYLSEEGAEQWDWMKNYRVWEANRKVFLYPENWIEPELRDDKTPFFKDLENELRQADITNETAETALVHYLEKLHDVARLQVCGQYLEQKDNGGVLHVFARTRDVPHHYYYRRGVLEVDVNSLAKDGVPSGAFDASWTHWERVDAEVEGDHLIPIVYNRRLYLFWPIFTSIEEAPFTKTLQSYLALYGNLFHLLIDLIQMVQNVGVAIVEGITNSLAKLIDSLERSIRVLPGGDSLGGLGDFVKQVNGIRDQMLSLIMGTTVNDSNRTDIENTKLDFLSSIEELMKMLESYQKYILSFLPAKRMEVQLAWSEYKHDSWSPKKTSANAVSFDDIASVLFENLPSLPGLSKLGSKRLFNFRGTVEADNQLTLHCEIALPILLDRDAHNPPVNQPFHWELEPQEIGYFHLNTCLGRLEAVDTAETDMISNLLKNVMSQVTSLVESVGEELKNLASDRQLHQRGEPVTVDDDPNRPSPFRNLVEGQSSMPPLPKPNKPWDVYRLLTRHQTTDPFAKLCGFFYQDSKRTFFCFPWPLQNDTSSKYPFHIGYVLFPFYHPYTCALLANIQQYGIPGIYDIRFDDIFPFPAKPNGKPLQLAFKNEDFFKNEYDLIEYVYNPVDGNPALRPIEEFNFSNIGAYSQYNWEVFFHIPLLIASRLSTNQKFREAQQWFHYIFNPTDTSRGSVPEKYWRTRPFAEASAQYYQEQQIDDLMLRLNTRADTIEFKELAAAVDQWRRNAFNPHLVARSRSVAFQKTVVMKYIDNLIAWGDHLFRQENREAINEATQLYILAAKLLGPRPRRIPKPVKRRELNFIELFNELPPLDAFSNALVEIESYLPQPSSGLNIGERPYIREGRGPLDRATLAPVGSAFALLAKSPSLQGLLGRNYGESMDPTQTAKALYFCVPPNDKLLEKWDTVADRLFKIRHCQNIEGQGLALPLLSPPIDPAILVRAKAMGVDIDEVLGQLYAQLPHYRFQTLAQKASELCGEVKALGGALLSALEKHDGEALALLRNRQETRLLEAVQAVKRQQIEEARLGLAELQYSKEATAIKLAHNLRLLMEFMNPEEIAHIGLGGASLMLQGMQLGAKSVSAAAHLIPNVKGGSPTTLGTTFGGDNIGAAAGAASEFFGQFASILSSVGGLISTMGGYRRRAEEWLLQITVAKQELQGLDKKIASAEIHILIAEADLENHKLQIQNSLKTNEFMQQKFTNQELYDWMVSQISTLYFQSYQMAYELARKAERGFAFELGVDNPGIIQPGYWARLKNGLLAGEHLHQDLKRLELAYLDKNIREFELTKHISLASLDPMQLIALRETGEAKINLPEALFDMDFPGHYFRRIKSVSISLPCVTGPYTGVNATLSLNKSRFRWTNDASGDYRDDKRFKINQAATRAIATSTGQNDSGLFELNFRDERYLPFEGEGVESQWVLSINGQFPQFDHDTISDVILHLRYTARDGREELKKKATTALGDLPNALKSLPWERLFSARHEFPSEWASFKKPSADPNPVFTLKLLLRPEHYPFWSQGILENRSTIKIRGRRLQDPTFTELTITPTGNLKQFGVPTKFVGEITLVLDANDFDDLLIEVTWKKDTP